MTKKMNYVNITFYSRTDGHITKGIKYTDTNDLYDQIEVIFFEYSVTDMTCFIAYPFNNRYTSPNKFRALKRLPISCIPMNSLQVWNPKFRGMNDEDILTLSGYESEYKPYGYRIAGYCNETATIYMIFNA